MSRIGSYHFDDSNVGVVIPDRNLDGADRNRAVIFDVNSLHSVEFDLIWQGDKLKMCGWMMPLIVRACRRISSKQWAAEIAVALSPSAATRNAVQINFGLRSSLITSRLSNPLLSGSPGSNTASFHWNAFGITRLASIVPGGQPKECCGNHAHSPFVYQNLCAYWRARQAL